MRSTVFTSKSPRIDLHGENPEVILYIILDFINYNIKLGHEYVGIVHGKGTGTIKNKVHEILKKQENVISFKLNNWNTGETIVRLKIEK